MAENGTDKKGRKDDTLWDTMKTVFYAVLVALLVRTFAYEPFNIPSGSMIPTLLVGDYLFVSKYSYGYSRYSLPWGLPLIPGRIFYEEPERGDIAVFKPPRHPSSDYIKRIIGLPGDTIQVTDGVLHINGEPVERRRIDDYVFHDDNGNVQRVKQYVETLPNGVKHRIIEETDSGSLDDTRKYQVPKGHFFMMGDNRDNSLDSRVLAGVGYVPKQNLVGEAQVLFFSTNGDAALWEVWNWPFAIRWNRLFDTVS